MSDHIAKIDDAVRWLRSLPESSVDMVLTDPPYSSGGYNEAQRRGGSSDSKSLPWLVGDALSTPAIAHLMREVALECRRVVKPSGCMYVFGDWKMLPVIPPVIESAGWRYRAMIVWDKVSHGSGQGWMPQHEIVMHFADPSTTYACHQPSVIRCKRVSNSERDHATQKPVDLLVAIMRSTLEPGAIVADPFAGSGSVIEAASRIGATAWCCDADPSHLPAMARRAAGREQAGVLPFDEATA